MNEDKTGFFPSYFPESSPHDHDEYAQYEEHVAPDSGTPASGEPAAGAPASESQNAQKILGDSAEILAFDEQSAKTSSDKNDKNDKNDYKDEDAFRTIGEISAMLDVPVHVIRFWCARFSAIRPMKGQGGRRYYRTEDVELLGGLRRLLHEEGYTIKGVHRLIRKKGIEFIRAKSEKETQNHDDPLDQILHGLIADLQHVKKCLQKFAA